MTCVAVVQYSRRQICLRSVNNHRMKPIYVNIRRTKPENKRITFPKMTGRNTFNLLGSGHMSQLNPRPLVNWVKPWRTQNEILANHSIKQCNLASVQFKCHIWGHTKMHFHCAPLSIICYSSEICFTGLVSLLYVFIILHSNVFIAPDCTKTKWKTVKLYTVCVFSSAEFPNIVLKW